MNRSTIVCILLILFSVAEGFTQSLHFQSFEEYFPSRPVSDFQIDHEGFLWITTFGGGIHRFDGREYESFILDPNNENSLTSNFATSVHEDAEQRLWVGTDMGLCLFNSFERSFRHIQFYDSNQKNTKLLVSVLSIEEDQKGNILLGTNKYGLIRFVTQDVARSNVLFIQVHPEMEELMINDIAVISDDHAMAVTNKGAMVYSFEDDVLESYLMPPSFEHLNGVPMQSAYFDGIQTLWLGTTSHGLVKLTTQINSKELLNIEAFPITTNRIMDISPWSKHTIGCATENDGLILYDFLGNKSIAYTFNDFAEESIESNSIWRLYADKIGRQWLGYYNKGIGLYDASVNKFESIKHLPNQENSLQGKSVNGIAVDKDKSIWVGMDGGGVDLISEDGSLIHLDKRFGYEGLVNKAVQNLFLDHSGNLWVGTWGGGIFLLRKGSKKFECFDQQKTRGLLRSNRVLSFDEDSEGVIWVATFGGGVCGFIPEQGQYTTLSVQTLDNHLLDESDVRDVLVDAHDNVWIGSTTGLYCWNRSGEKDTLISFTGHWRDLGFHPSFDHVLSLFEGSNGEIWIGTDGAGLFKYNVSKNQFVDFNSTWNIHQNTVCAIIEDNDQNIWATGKQGITKIDLGNALTYNFSKENGLLSNDFNYGSIAKDAEENLYFGNQDGMNWVNPASLTKTHQEVEPILVNFKLFNKIVRPSDKESPLTKELSNSKKITLNHLQSVFTIDFTAIDFNQADQLQFAYFLDGLEMDWNFVGSLRSATYTSLKPGEYVFRLKVTNMAGEWSEEKSVIIEVLPAWYKSRLAFVIYVVLFLAGLYLLYLLIRMRLRERQEVQYERHRHIQDELLNQRKLQFFTNISHEFRTPLTLIINPLESILKNGSLIASKVANQLETVQRNALRLERLINELMDFRKLNSGKLKLTVHLTNINDLINDVMTYFKEESIDRNIQLHVRAVSRPHLWIDAGLIEKVLFNLISNAFKFTPDGGHIEISISEKRHVLPNVDSKEIDTIQIAVSDTGPGLSEEHLNKIFDRFYQVEQFDKSYYGGTGIGLEVVKSFIELHHGRIEVESEVGKGTTFLLYFALGKAHFDENEIVLTEKIRQAHLSKVDRATQIENIEVSKQDDINDKKSVILCIEDNAELRTYLNQELKDLFIVKLAKNGEEGLEIAQELIPDIILTDIMMPGMDGYELCKLIKSNASTSHIPVVLVSARESVQDKIKGAELGADLYVSKPFNVTLLKEQLKQLLKSRQLLFKRYFYNLGHTVVDANIGNLDKDFLQRAVAFVKRNMSNAELSVEDLASELSLSRSQLYRKIKAFTDESVNSFIKRIRLENARQLIRSGTDNINEVSYLSGFSSASYFTKCYKEHFGVLPNHDRQGDSQVKNPS